MIDFLPPDLSQAHAIFLLAVSFATSLMTAALGIGGGAIFLAVAAVILPPAALIPVHGVVQLGSNAVRATMFRSHILRSALPAFTIGALIGVAIGGSVAVSLPPATVQIGIGLFLLWVVLGKTPAWIGKWPIGAGAFSSFLTMFFGATGPFVAAYVKTMQLDRHTHVATHAALMTVQHGLKVAMFAALGFGFAPWALFIAGLIVCSAAGTWGGKHVLGRMSDHGFHKVLNVLLILIALRLLWGGISTFL